MTTTRLAQNTDFLKTLVADESTTLREVDAFEFAVTLLSNLRSPDPVLRDELSYTILERLILSKKFTVQQLETMLGIVIDNDHLSDHIGETGTDSVFMRSFSALIVAAILGVDSHDPKLSHASVYSAVDAVLMYASEERDRRGFVDNKGWSHSVAHSADALNSCIKHPYTSAEVRVSIMDTLRSLAIMAEPLCFQEDNRLAYVALTAICGGLIEESYLIKWIQSFRHEVSPEKDTMLCHSKTEHFLRSLFFYLQWQPAVTSAIQQTISEVLKASNVHYQYGFFPNSVSE